MSACNCNPVACPRILPGADMHPPTSRSSRTVRRWAPVLIAAAVLSLVFGGIHAWRSVRLAAAAAVPAPPPVEVSVVTVAFERLPQWLDATGSLQAVQEVVLAPEVSGRVVAIRFEAGDDVAAGDVLVELFDAPERADRAAALARAQFARLEHERSQSLLTRGNDSLQRLQQRDADRAATEAAVAQIEARLAQKTVRAPFAGRLGIRRVNLGQYVNAGDPIAALVALDRLYVNFSVPQQDLARLRVGGGVTVRSDAFPDRRFDARINAIEPKVGTDSRNVAVQATLVDPDRCLRPGLYVMVEVAQPPREDTILVPVTAVQTTASGDSVVVVSDGRAEVVPVVAGRRIGDRVVVERGLGPGDAVVIGGQLRIRPGGRVTVAAADASPETSRGPTP